MSVYEHDELEPRPLATVNASTRMEGLSGASSSVRPSRSRGHATSRIAAAWLLGVWLASTWPGEVLAVALAEAALHDERARSRAPVVSFRELEPRPIDDRRVRTERAVGGGGFGVQLVLDDGSAEGTVGVADGDGGLQFLWFQRFTPPLSDFDLQEICVLFPSHPQIAPGAAIQLVVYRDPDGDPTNGAELLLAVDETVAAADGVAVSTFPLVSPVEFRGGGDVLIGVVNRFVVSGVTPPTSPAAIDTTTSQGRSWIAIWTGDPPNPPVLPPDQLLARIDDLVPTLAGNWMISGFGSPPPITLELIPSTTAATIGEAVTVDVVVSGLGDLSPPSLGGFDLDLLFDPAVVSFTGAVYGAELGDPALAEATTATTPGAGTVNLLEQSLLAPAVLEANQPGAFTLLSASFDAVGAGSALFDLVSNGLEDANSAPLVLEPVMPVTVEVSEPAPFEVPSLSGWVLALLAVLLGWVATRVLGRPAG